MGCVVVNFPFRRVRLRWAGAACYQTVAVNWKALHSLVAAFALLLPAASVLSAEPASSWPQWRGPMRDGQVAASPTWPRQFDEHSLEKKWYVPLGQSYSGPIVTADRVFVTETRDKSTEVVRALSRETGQQLWIAEWSGAMTVPFFARENGDWIRATPAFDGQSLFVAGMRDVLVCLDADNGQERWRVDFVERYKTSLPSFGFVSSPLVDDNYVYVQAGAAFCKLDKRTGEVLWRSLQDSGGMMDSAFSSPIKATIAGQSQLVVQTRERLAGVDQQTGQELWSQPIEAFRGMNILTPIVVGDSIFTSAYGGKSRMFDLTKVDNPGPDRPALTVTERWQNKAQAYMSTPIVIDGHAYLHLRNQRFTCIELATGKERWTTTPYGKYWSLVAQGNTILALDERGDLLLIAANPDRFELIGQQHISQSPTWAHLAVCDNEIFIRDLTGMTVYGWGQSTSGE
ncbi:MAG: PQQ-like beta-propeller repeat protein [Pirellulaceae bacterium]|nr:PQQ-like beta-propeller repeat protein [Pirellulaceae bacterium]